MTKNEAYGKILHMFIESDDIDHADLVTMGRLTGLLSSLLGLIYERNMEIVDRTIDEDTARNLDNELSWGEPATDDKSSILTSTQEQLAPVKPKTVTRKKVDEYTSKLVGSVDPTLEMCTLTARVFQQILNELDIEVEQ